MNPLPDCSNYSPFCHTHYLTLDQYLTSLFGPDTSNTSLLQLFTCRISWELRRNTVPWGSWTTSRGKCRCSLSSLQIVNSVPFSHISILSLLPFSILSLLPLHHPFFWLILCLPKIKTSNFITIRFTNGTYFCILFHTTYFFNNTIYKLVKTKFWCLRSNLSYPEDLKQWLHHRAGSRKFLGGEGSLRPSFSSNCLFVSFFFSILSLLPFLISPTLSTILLALLVNSLS